MLSAATTPPANQATCVIPQIFKGAQELTDCIADYHPGVEDKEAYGPFYTEPEWANAFSYTKTWPQFWGEIRHYNKGAYGIELPAASCKTNAGADVEGSPFAGNGMSSP